MDVNSVAFKNKCRFALSPRYELFFGLAAAAARWPGESHALKPWQGEVRAFLGKQESLILAGLELSSVVPSFFPAEEASLSPQRMLEYLEKLENKSFLSLFLLGLLHDRKVCECLVEGSLTLKEAISQIGRKKREWLDHLGLYPFDAGNPKIHFFQWLLQEDRQAQRQLVGIYSEWWNEIFSHFWNAKKDLLQESLAAAHGDFERMNFEDFATKALLKIRPGLKGDSLEALRGGYKIRCEDIDHVYFLPSVFNEDRLWSALERPKENKVVYFPFLDLDLLQKLGDTAPSSGLDGALMCRAVGDPTRFALLALLAKEPHSAAALAQKLDLTRATVSHHVSLLREAGILSDDGHGRRLHVHWENLSALSNVLLASLTRRSKSRRQ